MVLPFCVLSFIFPFSLDVFNPVHACVVCLYSRVQQPFGSSKSPFDDVGSSQAQQVVQIEEDVDIQLLQEREQAIKQLEVCWSLLISELVFRLWFT